MKIPVAFFLLVSSYCIYSMEQSAVDGKLTFYNGTIHEVGVFYRSSGQSINQGDSLELESGEYATAHHKKSLEAYTTWHLPIEIWYKKRNNPKIYSRQLVSLGSWEIVEDEFGQLIVNEKIRK